MIELSDENRISLYIPKGFAHGFLVLSDGADVIYFTDNPYSRESEGGIIWNYPRLAIPWPIREPIVSNKDRSWPPLSMLP